MSASEEEINPYELLSVKVESTEQEIKTAYRQRSLKVHPDRNPNNPDAARKFHELNQAYELLLDPLRRLALDAKLRIKLARTERYKSYDNKRKNLVEELEERERAFKKVRVEKQKEEAEAWTSNERIKEEGKRLREEKEKELRAKLQTPSEPVLGPVTEEELPPSMDPLDTTVRIKYSFKAHPSLTTAENVAAFVARFGAADESSIVLSSTLKGKKTDKAPKTGTALIPFKQIGDAFAAVCASERKELGMEGVKISWVKGEEPAILSWLRKMGKLGTSSVAETSPQFRPESATGTKADLPQNQPKAASGTTYASFPSTLPDNLNNQTSTPAMTGTPAAPNIDYESLTLMRMRQAERERIEKEILEQEAEEACGFV
ncbi:DnaJ domain-containing protein [Crepidotus variabilis]|uniref:DnaJ domain-containing protein n=1 Tax=Crepidotus variabilis TaxID=179855 RepID=A0A9P6JR00_9AGAR|nr:DnaJ domain-containing protein [Crepidotus variabilis]